MKLATLALFIIAALAAGHRNAHLCKAPHVAPTAELPSVEAGPMDDEAPEPALIDAGDVGPVDAQELEAAAPIGRAP